LRARILTTKIKNFVKTINDVIYLQRSIIGLWVIS